MHVFEESDSGVVPMNRLNKDGKPLAESEEGRPLIKENAHQPNTFPTQSEKRVSQGLASVRIAARERRKMDLSRFLRQPVKTQFSSNGELCHGIVSQAVHQRVQTGRH